MSWHWPPLRFLAVAALLASTAIFLWARTEREKLAARRELASFPREVAGWSSRELGIDPSVREVLGPGEFLSRIYSDANQPPVDLFIGYFPSQRTGNSIHSPKNCLPGSGWSPVQSGYVQLRVMDGRTATVNRYVISKGLDRQVVLYWYQAHGRAVASEYWAKFYLVGDAIRMNRTDGALVRVSTPMFQGETAESAERRIIGFAEHIFPGLDAYIPR
jgi:EpsI family protein